MIILGVDPGIARIGWAVIAMSHPKIFVTSCGLISTDKGEAKEERLCQLHEGMCTIIKKYSPDVMSVEDLFFAKNAKTAIAVGEARGVILLSASQSHIPVVSYTPLSVKRTITGDGHADKKQVEKMVRQMFCLKQISMIDDTMDAIAIAATHAYTNRFGVHSS